VTFMPALMLSGFLFDLNSMPTAMAAVTYVFPGRYYVSLLQTLFLTGDVWVTILPNAGALALMAAVLLRRAHGALRKSLE
jgi:ABC-2 type transport system permease protein